MRTGIITHYATDMEQGIIRDEAGDEFAFKRPSFLHMDDDPQAGYDVTFELQGLIATNVSILAKNQNYWA